MSGIEEKNWCYKCNAVAEDENCRVCNKCQEEMGIDVSKFVEIKIKSLREFEKYWLEKAQYEEKEYANDTTRLYPRKMIYSKWLSYSNLNLHELETE